MKKILITLDYNPSAQKVAETGYALANAMNASVSIIHVITEAAWYAQDYSPIMGFQGSYTEGTMQLVEEIRKQAEDFLAATVKHLGATDITTSVLDGEIIDSILDYSDEWGADLLVLGSHSHHGFDRLFGTDIAASILKRSKIPVLAIPTAPTQS